MNDERDSVPSGADTPAPDATTDDIVVVNAEDTAASDTLSGADGVAGGDVDGPEPSGDEEPRPKSRWARQRDKLRAERDHALNIAAQLDQQVRGVAQERAVLAQRAMQAERAAVEHQYAYLKTLENNFAQAKRQALETGNSEALVAIDRDASRLGAALHQVEQARARFGQQPPPVAPPPVMPQQQMPQRQPPQRLHPAAEKWAEAHADWLESGPQNVNIARSVGRALEEQGLTPDSPAYYAKLNEGIKIFSPDFRSDFNPAAARSSASTPRDPGVAVAGVNRASSDPPRQSTRVVLTPEDRAFCERNGINPKSYARAKLEREQSAPR